MKFKNIISLIISTVVGISFFTSMSNAAGLTDAQKQKDGEIIAFIMTVDKNEIAVAKLAMKKSNMPAIKKFAKMLKHQHTKNLNQAMRLSKKTGIVPVNTAAVTALQQDGAKGLAKLTSLNGKDFDNAFIDAMVDGHTDVLKAINDDFLKNASNPAVKKFVVATKPHIESHLQQALIIQKELN